MLDTTNLSIAGLVAHAGINPETQRELQLAVMRTLNNAPTGINIQQKQLALIVALEELSKAYPADCQATNALAVVATLMLGPRLLMATTTHAPAVDPEGLH